MEVIYGDHQIKIRISPGERRSIDKKYIEDFLTGSVIPIRDAFDELIGLDIQRA